MDTDLTQVLLRMQADLTNAIHNSEQRTGARIDKLTEQQVIANGRTSKLERAHDALRTKVRLLTDRGSVIGSFSNAQKAKLAGFGLLIAGAIAEGVHRVIPILITLLSGTVSQP